MKFSFDIPKPEYAQFQAGPTTIVIEDDGCGLKVTQLYYLKRNHRWFRDVPWPESRSEHVKADHIWERIRMITCGCPVKAIIIGIDDNVFEIHGFNGPQIVDFTDCGNLDIFRITNVGWFKPPAKTLVDTIYHRDLWEWLSRSSQTLAAKDKGKADFLPEL